ncbi:MAG: CRTAC1 family protein [Bacteroidetes bacterium]|nr:CRTAC1 family protein [Bacteroidota bacterium]
MKTRIYFFLIALWSCDSCSEPETRNKQFSFLKEESTGIDFNNKLDYTEDFNMYTYRNFYNGAGVGIGDFNNDGLVDLYLCANMLSNKLYLNKGNFKFEDVTERSGVSASGSWSTGVSIADVNGDHWQDIYVCKSGKPGGPKRHNELFMNNGDGTFTEKSQEWGLDIVGLSTHAVFFDYDNDGDLDCYMLTNSIRSVGNYDLVKDQRAIPDPLGGGNKLLENVGGHFIDVTKKAGIYSSQIGFGLGVTIGDMNKDGWQDIFVSNDFFERDYLYLNQANGTFREVIEQEMKSLSMGSMGADMADINNDAYPDLFITEMLPQSNSRLKTKMTFDTWNHHQMLVQNGYYYQYPRNILQLNNGDGTFSEIGRLAGVESTDWSWGALIFDMDNDGWKDIFVANGIYKDLLDQDYVNFMANPEAIRSMISEKKSAITKLIEIIPSTPIANYAFKNLKDLRFKNQSQSWGLDQLGFSNGSAYADFDNDGDLDLVVNNVNQPAGIYRNNNNLTNPQNHYLKFELHGAGSNTAAFGTKVTLYSGDKTFYLEKIPTRGFQSSVDPRLNFGVGELSEIDKARIEWPSGKVTELNNLKVNQTISVSEK